MNTKSKLIFAILLSTTVVLGQSKVNDSAHSRDVKALVIVYDVSYPKNKPTIESVNINKVITIIYNSKIITTTYTETGDITTAMSTDANENCFGLLEDQNLMIKSSRNDNLNLKGVKFSKTITFTNALKNILGYECKENEIRIEVQVGNFTTKTCTNIYTYDKFKDYGLNYTNIKGANGLMLGSYTDLTGGVIQVTTAKSISEQFLDSTTFNIPINFSVLTMDEYTNKYQTDANFRKKINEKFKIKEFEMPVVANKSTWKIFLKALLDNAPEILNTVGNTVKTISDIKKGNTAIVSQPISTITNDNSQQNARVMGKQTNTNANNNEYYNQYYTKESQKSKDQADYYYNEAQKYLKNVEFYVKENNTDKASLNKKWYDEAMDKYKQYSGNANDEQRKAQNYK